MTEVFRPREALHDGRRERLHEGRRDALHEGRRDALHEGGRDVPHEVAVRYHRLRGSDRCQLQDCLAGLAAQTGTVWSEVYALLMALCEKERLPPFRR